MIPRDAQPQPEAHADDRPIGGLPARELRLFAISASLLAHLAVGLVLALLILDPPAASIGVT